jgi:Cu(I)/Ag(I) efflux system membrane fusion protein
MTVSRRKLSIWVMGLATMAAALGGSLWFAHRRGWLMPVEARVRELASSGESWARRFSSKGKERSGGGMGMAMPGMEMGGEGGPPEVISGYTAVEVTPEIQQRIGVTVGRVEREPLRMSVRTVGITRPDETKEARIHLRTDGWVEKLFVNYTGQEIRKGDPLLLIYSPEFFRAQFDYANAVRGVRDRSLSGGERTLTELAIQKLRLLGVSEPELKELERTGKTQEYMTLRSPVTGTVLSKNVLEEEYVMPSKELYVVADLATVWVQAKIYEYELPHIELGKAATVTVPALPGREFPGKVVFIKPTVEEATRTVEVRVELPNPDRRLKPGMFADIVIQHDMGEGLLVPTSTVIHTGTRDIAFRVDKGRFLPVDVEIGAIKFDDRFQVLKGLEAGDEVETSGNFLIDSESRLRLGGGGMAGMHLGSMPGMNMGGMPGMEMEGMKGREGGGMRGTGAMDRRKPEKARQP